MLLFAPLSHEEHLDAQSRREDMGFSSFMETIIQMLLELLEITVRKIAVLQGWQICSLFNVLSID
jgi:hypothetical protein